MTDIWICGAFQPDPAPQMLPYRCTETSGHTGPHRTLADGKVLAEWQRQSGQRNT